MKIKEKISYYRDKYPFLKQIVKFCIVGGTAAIINFSIYYSATEKFDLWYVYSAIVAFIISAIFNFTANKLWTFRNREVGFTAFKQTVKFAIVMVSGLIINTSLIYIITEWVGFDYKVSWVIATGVVTFWSFGFNRFWTFRIRPVMSDQILPKES